MGISAFLWLASSDTGYGRCVLAMGMHKCVYALPLEIVRKDGGRRGWGFVGEEWIRRVPPLAPSAPNVAPTVLPQ